MEGLMRDLHMNTQSEARARMLELRKVQARRHRWEACGRMHKIASRRLAAGAGSPWGVWCEASKACMVWGTGGEFRAV